MAPEAIHHHHHQSLSHDQCDLTRAKLQLPTMRTATTASPQPAHSGSSGLPVPDESPPGPVAPLPPLMFVPMLRNLRQVFCGAFRRLLQHAWAAKQLFSHTTWFWRFLCSGQQQHAAGMKGDGKKSMKGRGEGEEGRPGGEEEPGRQEREQGSRRMPEILTQVEREEEEEVEVEEEKRQLVEDWEEECSDEYDDDDEEEEVGYEEDSDGDQMDDEEEEEEEELESDWVEWESEDDEDEDEEVDEEDCDDDVHQQSSPRASTCTPVPVTQSPKPPRNNEVQMDNDSGDEDDDDDDDDDDDVNMDCDDGSDWSEDDDGGDSESSAESVELWESFLHSDDPYNPLSFSSSTHTSPTKNSENNTHTSTIKNLHNTLTSPVKNSDNTSTSSAKTPNSTNSSPTKNFDNTYASSAKAPGNNTHSSPTKTPNGTNSSPTKNFDSTYTSPSKNSKNTHTPANNIPESTHSSPSFQGERRGVEQHTDEERGDKQLSSHNLKQHKKVRFSDELVSVRPLVAWSFASRAARDGSCWMQMARDRGRFRRRVAEAGRVISPCLSPQHRRLAWERLQNSVL